MATDAGAELRVDVHNIEPIPEADKDSTGPQLMWIWAGANIAPINWALGALGIVLKLGLWETIAVIVLGNIVGCAIFAAFTVMGHKTGVNQMVLGRSAFGRRGAYLPSVLMFLMTLGCTLRTSRVQSGSPPSPDYWSRPPCSRARWPGSER